MDILRYLLVSLHDRLPLDDGLINSLYSSGLLNGGDVERLKRGRRDEAIDCLVTEILPFADPAKFPTFCKALQATNAEHALRPIRAVVETIVHFQGIPPETVLSSSFIIIVDIRLRESFYREFPTIRDRLFASVAVELIYANLTGFYRNACMSTQNVHALNRKLVIITGPATAESQNLCYQIANLVKIDRNVIAYHCSQQRAWEQSQSFQFSQSTAIQSQVLAPYLSHDIDLHPSHSEPNVQYLQGREASPPSKDRPVTPLSPSHEGEGYHAARHMSLPGVRELPSGRILKCSDESLSSSTPIQEEGSAPSSMTQQPTSARPIQEEEPMEGVGVASPQNPNLIVQKTLENVVVQGRITEGQASSGISMSSSLQDEREEAQRLKGSQSAPISSHHALPSVERSEALQESRKAENEFPASFSLCVRGMTLKFTKAQNVFKYVGQSGDKIRSEFFSLSIPPQAVVGSAVNVGFALYEYQSEESEGVEDDTEITDLLVLYPCGRKFADNVTMTMRLLSCSEQQNAFLFYKGPDSVSYSDTCVGMNPTDVRGGTEMSAVLCESCLEITTQHFCRFFAGVFRCIGHTYYVLAFGRWTKGQNFCHLTKAVVDIRFTSSRMRCINELKARYKQLPLLLEQKAIIYFNDAVGLQIQRVSSGWRLHSNKHMLIEKRSLKQARKGVMKEHTESLTLKKTKEKAADEIWLEVRLICGKRRSILLTLQEYSSNWLRDLPQEVTPVIDSDEHEILRRKPTGRELNQLSKELTLWKPVARCLLVPEPNITEIERKYANDPREQVYQALLQWMQQESESASVKALCRALRDESQTAIAAKVFELSDEVLRDQSL